MDEKSFLKLFEEVLELDEGSLTGDDKLDVLDSWDSLAVLGLISLVDRHFGKILSAKDINNAKTVNDLYKLTQA